MGDLGLPGSVVEIADAAWQRDVWEVRKAGLNIMMSMKGDGKPVSFIEDCAVPLEHLADYTDRLTQVFEKHGTRGTFYAHASVGCLHVRPVLNLRTEHGAQQDARDRRGGLRARQGIQGLVLRRARRRARAVRVDRARVRPATGARVRRDQAGVRPEGPHESRQDRRRAEDGRSQPVPLQAGLRRRPPLATGLDWSEHEVGPENRGRGFAAAVEMCNNNGHCRKFDAGTMCPSYRVTHDEQHVTRGRANSLRLALSGQLGPDALASRELYDTLALCVSCKGCKRECPTGVDMAAMKIEFLHQYHRRRPRSLHDRLVAHLPRYRARGCALGAAR